MLRLAGALLLVGGAAFLGFSAAAGLGRRVRSLRSLLGALELMEREIAFRLTPMPDLLDALSARTPPPLSAFFARCRDGLGALGEKDLGQLWREGLEEAPMGLADEELALLAELGEVLGRYDGEGQRAALERTRLALEETLRRAEEDKSRQGRMYGVLGLTAGAFLVIMLI